MAEIQQPDIIGNYLQQYYGAQDRNQAQAQQQLQNQRQAVADQRTATQFDQQNQQFQWTKEQHDMAAKADAVSNAIMNIRPGDVNAFNAAKQSLLSQGIITPQEASQYDINHLQDLQMQSEKWRQVKEFQLKQQTGQSALQTDQAQRGLIGAQTDEARAQADFVKSGKGKFGKPMSGSLQNKETDLLNDVQIAANNNADVSMYLGKIKTGELDPGLLYNNYNRAKSFFGVVDPADKNTIAYSNFLSDMKRLQNESLRLNKGVQTEGDAQRAWNELFDNINDKNIVASRLDRIAKLNARAAQQKAGLVRNQRRNYFGSNYQEPNWEELGIDPTLVAPPTARPVAPAAPAAGGAGKPDTSKWSTKRVG